VPTVAPSSVPTLTSFPTFAKSNRPVVAGSAPTAPKLAQVKVVQKLTGITADAALTSAFQKAFKSAVLTTLGLDPAVLTNTVTINSVNAARRQLLVDPSISIDYTVQATDVAASDLSATITTASAVAGTTSTGALVPGSFAAQLAIVGFPGLTAAAPTVIDQSPTSAPSKVPSSANSLRASSGATLTVGLIVGFLVTMLA
jgi:hypothetical protein